MNLAQPNSARRITGQAKPNQVNLDPVSNPPLPNRPVYIEQQSACHTNDAPKCKTNLPVDTRYKVAHIHDLRFSKICHFALMTQPNPLKKIRIHSRPNPTQPSDRPTARKSNSGGDKGSLLQKSSDASSVVRCSKMMQSKM